MARSAITVSTLQSSEGIDCEWASRGEKAAKDYAQGVRAPVFYSSGSEAPKTMQ